MKRTLLTSSPQRWVFALTFLACLSSILTSGQSDKSAHARLPGGNYTVACRAFMGQGYESLPVLVTSVTSDSDNGLAIRNFSVENMTQQAVESVRVRWYLSRAETPETILSQGETPMLRIQGGIQPGAAKRLKYRVTSFAAAVRPVLKTPNLSGNYMIQLAVGEARFTDGSTQTFLAFDSRTLPTRALFVKTAHRPRTFGQGFCPGQHCTEVLASGVPVGFKCADSTGESCTNSANGKSCTSTICGTGTGGDDEFDVDEGPNT